MSWAQAALGGFFLCAALGGCAAPEAAPAVGRLEVPLQISDAQGRVFRLAGTFDLVGPESLTITVSASDPTGADPVLALTPTSGQYALTLSAFQLYEQDPITGVVTPRLDATLANGATQQVFVPPTGVATARFELRLPPRHTCTAPCLAAVSIASRKQLTIAALEDGRLYGWGENVPEPVTLDFGLGAITRIDHNDYTGCFIAGASMPYCWGSNDAGQLGDPSAVSGPVTPVGLGPSSQIEVGAQHACARQLDGQVWCWGRNARGQLGDGGTTDSPVPIAVAGLADATSISVAPDHSCAPRTDGTLWCWGANQLGQLGDGSRSDRALPTRVTGLSDVVEVAAGATLTCARERAGRVWCWGENAAGLGDGASVQSDVPVQVAGLDDAVELSTTSGFACARRQSDEVVCWGDNSAGQLGDGTLLDRATPVSVPGLFARTLGAGDSFACATRTSGSLVCWGANDLQQLGAGGVVTDAPHAVSGVWDALSLSARGDHTCALRANGTSVCWGKNASGQLGDQTFLDRAAPVVAQGVFAQAISTGAAHSCALGLGGSVSCWGENAAHELGDGTTSDSASPVSVQNVLGAVALGDALQSTCAVDGAGGVSCWGDSPYHAGALASSVAGIADATSVSGARHQCAVRANTRVACWGDNDLGQLGDGSAQSRAVPADVLLAGGVPLDGVVEVSTGPTHTCALDSGGRVFCWGDNAHGQLGDGSVDTQPLPVEAYGVTGAVDVVCGPERSCAVLASGALWCWGASTYRSNADSAYAYPIYGLYDVTSAVLGTDHVCALREAGQVLCWGVRGNVRGQFGAGYFARSSTPLDVLPPQPATCGNGALDAGELCDDGNTSDRDACPRDCHAPTQLALDHIAAQPRAAYSVERRLRSAYVGPLVAVECGGVQVDVGSDALQQLDVAQLASACGAADGYVVVLYDQSGRGNDLRQDDPSKRIRFYDGASQLVTSSGSSAVLRSSAAGEYVERADILGLPFEPSITVVAKAAYLAPGSQGDDATILRIGGAPSVSLANELALRFANGYLAAAFGAGDVRWDLQSTGSLRRYSYQSAAMQAVRSAAVRVDYQLSPRQSFANESFAHYGLAAFGTTRLGKDESDTAGAVVDTASVVVWDVVLEAADLAALELWL